MGKHFRASPVGLHDFWIYIPSEGSDHWWPKIERAMKGMPLECFGSGAGMGWSDASFWGTLRACVKAARKVAALKIPHLHMHISTNDAPPGKYVFKYPRDWKGRLPKLSRHHSNDLKPRTSQEKKRYLFLCKELKKGKTLKQARRAWRHRKPTTAKEKRRQALSKKIAYLVKNEGYGAKQATAIAYAMLRKEGVLPKRKAKH